MLRSILTLSTTIAVAAHAFLGCCAHHGHACSGHEGHVEVVAGHDPDCHSHVGREDATSSNVCRHEEDRPQQGGDEPCDEPDCRFVTTLRGDDVTLAWLNSAWFALPADERVVSGLNAALLRALRTDGPSGHVLSPEPLRALTQVWLL